MASRTLNILGVTTLLGMIATFYFALVFAPTEATMGTVQRIFYIHAPAGIVSYVAMLVVGLGSVMFLRDRKADWDRLAYCSAEIGLLFILINISMGMLWAKPVWFSWWVWDARLTIQLLLGLVFVAYLMLGAYIKEPTKRAPLQAVFGVLGSANALVSYMAIRWWRGQHPEPVIAGGPDSGLAPDMWIAFVVAIVSLLLLYAYLMKLRLALARSDEAVEYFEQILASR